MKPKTVDGRNITDNYFGWENLDIKEDLDSKRFNYGVLCCNIVGDYNLSCIVRTANVFLAKEVIIFGKKKWDRRGAVGTHHYTNFKLVKQGDPQLLLEILSEYDHIIGVDNIPNAKALETIEFSSNKKYLFCFGEERVGLSQEIIEKCDSLVYINQFGSCRSLNVAVAAGIIMQNFVSRRNVCAPSVENL